VELWRGVELVGAYAAIEITPQADGQFPVELVKEAYRASARAPVVLVLRSSDFGAVDMVLDPIVPLFPLGIPGVVYVDVNNETAVIDAVTGADMVFAATEGFRDLVARAGIAHELMRPLASAIETLKARNHCSADGASSDATKGEAASTCSPLKKPLSTELRPCAGASTRS
jgi:hypothetical protein